MKTIIQASCQNMKHKTGQQGDNQKHESLKHKKNHVIINIQMVIMHMHVH